MQRDANVFRVGLTVLLAVAILAAGILVIGKRNFLFSATNRYRVQFETVAGLAEGNPVQLNGVNVGSVERIVLPENVSEPLLVVWIDVERRYASRVREDSQARIKTLGLLGDKYVDITTGSPAAAEIPPGGEIPAAQPTDVDKLIASGEDVAENIVRTASSLAQILGRMEAGEGILGELLVERPDGRRVTDTLQQTLESVESVTARIERGEGLVGRLLTDRDLADRVEATVSRFDSILDEVTDGDGILPGLLGDAEAKAKMDATLESLAGTMADLEIVAAELRSGRGLLPRLLNDEATGETVTRELEQLLERLNLAAGRLTEGEGTAARLLNDPDVYEALNDILVGVDESKMLRWLVRNRQKAGIKKRYEETQEEVKAEAGVPNGQSP